MKTKSQLNLWALGAIALSLPMVAQAGEREGHGGGGIVCLDSNKVIRKAFLVDTWEAEHIGREENGFKPLTIVHDAENSTDGQVANALHKVAEFNDYSYRQIESAVQKVYKKLQKLPVKVKKIEDSNDFAVPDDLPGLDCERVQLADYTDDFGIVVSSSIWDNLDATDQAALILHEAIYLLDRQPPMKATMSDHARKLVGYIFSTSPLRVDLFGPLVQICKDIKLELSSHAGQFGPGWISLITVNGSFFGNTGIAVLSRQQTSRIIRYCGIPNMKVTTLIDYSEDRRTFPGCQTAVIVAKDAATDDILASEYVGNNACQSPLVNINKYFSFSIGR